MYPILFKFGDIAVPSWHVLYVLAAITTFVLAIHIKRKHYPEVSERFLASLYIVCYIGSYLGSRFLSILIEQPDISGPLNIFLALFQLGPLTFYGGAIGCFVSGYLYLRIQNISLPKILDIATVAGLAGLAVGRIGCFLNGCDYGKPIDLATGDSVPIWALQNPVLQDQIYRYPAQLISSVTVAMLVLYLYFGFSKLNKFAKPGIVGLLGISGYSLVRFQLEFIRGDDRGWVLEGVLSTSQFVAILVLFVVALNLKRWHKG